MTRAGSVAEEGLCTRAVLTTRVYTRLEEEARCCPTGAGLASGS